MKMDYFLFNCTIVYQNTTQNFFNSIVNTHVILFKNKPFLISISKFALRYLLLYSTQNGTYKHIKGEIRLHTYIILNRQSINTLCVEETWLLASWWRFASAIGIHVSQVRTLKVVSLRRWQHMGWTPLITGLKVSRSRVSGWGRAKMQKCRSILTRVPDLRQ